MQLKLKWPNVRFRVNADTWCVPTMQFPVYANFFDLTQNESKRFIDLTKLYILDTIHRHFHTTNQSSRTLQARRSTEPPLTIIKICNKSINSVLCGHRNLQHLSAPQNGFICISNHLIEHTHASEQINTRASRAPHFRGFEKAQVCARGIWPLHTHRRVPLTACSCPSTAINDINNYNQRLSDVSPGPNHLILFPVETAVGLLLIFTSRYIRARDKCEDFHGKKYKRNERNTLTALNAACLTVYGVIKCF